MPEEQHWNRYTFTRKPITPEALEGMSENPGVPIDEFVDDLNRFPHLPNSRELAELLQFLQMTTEESSTYTISLNLDPNIKAFDPQEEDEN